MMQHKQYNKDMSKDEDMNRLAEENYQKYGLASVFRYVGPMGDRGGGLKDTEVKKVNVLLIGYSRV